MPSWFILSAVGRDRPGLVADLAQLVYDCDANLEDSRMTLLGNEFAAILLCSGTDPELEQRLGEGARRLEWENRLKINYLISDAETGERMTRGSTVQVAVEIASREMLLASPKVLVEAVERALL